MNRTVPPWFQRFLSDLERRRARYNADHLDSEECDEFALDRVLEDLAKGKLTEASVQARFRHRRIDAYRRQQLHRQHAYRVAVAAGMRASRRSRIQVMEAVGDVVRRWVRKHGCNTIAMNKIDGLSVNSISKILRETIDRTRGRMEREKLSLRPKGADLLVMAQTQLPGAGYPITVVEAVLEHINEFTREV